MRKKYDTNPYTNLSFFWKFPYRLILLNVKWSLQIIMLAKTCSSSGHEVPCIYMRFCRFFCCFLCGFIEMKNLGETLSATRKVHLKFCLNPRKQKQNKPLKSKGKKLKNLGKYILPIFVQVFVRNTINPIYHQSHK